MKLIELHEVYEKDYFDYVIIIKSGYFYEVYGKGAIILNNLFDYKIKKVSGGIRVGFPISSFNKVDDMLNSFEINHILLEGGFCIYRRVFKNNRFDEFLYDMDFRINKICEDIHLLKNSPKINDILSFIESNL